MELCKEALFVDRLTVLAAQKVNSTCLHDQYGRPETADFFFNALRAVCTCHSGLRLLHPIATKEFHVRLCTFHAN